MIDSIRGEIRKGRIYAVIERNARTANNSLRIEVAGFEYEKYLPNEGQEVSIDLTPYCEAYTPGTLKEVYDVIGSGDVLNAAHYSRSVECRINGNDIGEIYYRNARNQGGYSNHTRLLTKLPYLQVSPLADYNELFLAFHSPSLGYASVTCGDESVTIEGDSNISTLQYTAFMPSDATALSIYDGIASETIDIPIRTVPSGMNTRRLVWLNELGGVDTWHFEFLRESSFATSSDVFYSSTKGYTRTNRISERAHIIETRELDDITASVVAYVIASPEVYLWESGTLVPIDIVTEECRTYSDTELSSIQVAYRLKEREL